METDAAATPAAAEAAKPPAEKKKKVKKYDVPCKASLVSKKGASHVSVQS
jgi:hypothetical protein